MYMFGLICFCMYFYVSEILLKRNLERLSTYKTRRWEKLQRFCEVHMADIRIKCLFLLRDPRSTKNESYHLQGDRLTLIFFFIVRNADVLFGSDQPQMLVKRIVSLLNNT